MAGKEHLTGLRGAAYNVTEASQFVDGVTIGIGVIAGSAPVVALGIVGILAGEYVKDKLKHGQG